MKKLKPFAEIKPDEKPEVEQENKPAELSPETVNKPGDQLSILSEIGDNLSQNATLSENTGRKKMTPEERQKRKAEREGKKAEAEQKSELDIEMYFSPVLGGLFLNTYIVKVLGVKDIPAEQVEIDAFTDSIRGIAKKYMSEAMKNNIELVNFALVMTSVTLARLDMEKIKNKVFNRPNKEAIQ